MPLFLQLARQYHFNLPRRIREYLWRERGIPDTVIDRYLLGWNESRITIPIFNRQGELAFFKLAKDPEDKGDSPKMMATLGAKAELYDWERVLAKPEEIIICEGEFDRLVLEGRGFAAVTSTNGAATFRPEWAEAFSEIPHVYVCFDNDAVGLAGAKRVAKLIPHARIVRLPKEVGNGGDVTDFFVRLGRSREEFLHLLEAAEPLPQQDVLTNVKLGRVRSHPATHNDAEQVKLRVAIEDLVDRYVHLRRNSRYCIGLCPFHEDHNPSFVVYPNNRSFYCFGCKRHGDIFNFIMHMEHLTFPEAVRVLRELAR